MVIQTKRKKDLVEMIVCGCITNQLSKEPIKDISSVKVNTILKERNI